MTQEWFVEIVEHETGRLEKCLGPYVTQRLAERADDGVNRNLNHDAYFTRIVYSARSEP